MTYEDGSLSTSDTRDTIRLHLHQEREAAIREERTRLARDIHDTLAQAFIGIAIQLEAAEGLLYTDIKQASIHIGRARQLALDSIAEARRTIVALRAPALDDNDLATALMNAVQQVMEGTSLNAKFELDGDPVPLPEPLEVELLRVAQEALTNVVKHANATDLTVRLTFTPDELQLRVEDNGVGFSTKKDVDQPIQRTDLSGYGLIGMRERTERIQGEIEINSSPSHGTCIVVSVPLANVGQFVANPTRSHAYTEPSERVRAVAHATGNLNAHRTSTAQSILFPASSIEETISTESTGFDASSPVERSPDPPTEGQPISEHHSEQRTEFSSGRNSEHQARGQNPS